MVSGVRGAAYPLATGNGTAAVRAGGAPAAGRAPAVHPGRAAHPGRRGTRRPAAHPGLGRIRHRRGNRRGRVPFRPRRRGLRPAVAAPPGRGLGRVRHRALAAVRPQACRDRPRPRRGDPAGRLTAWHALADIAGLQPGARKHTLMPRTALPARRSCISPADQPRRGCEPRHTAIREGRARQAPSPGQAAGVDSRAACYQDFCACLVAGR
jgi:hypothetical protein